MTKTVAIPTTLEEITAVWLTNALRSTGVIGEETAVSSLTIEPISGAGYMGQIYRLLPKYDKSAGNKPHSFIAKLPHRDPEMRKNLFWTCEREIFFYQELAHQISLTTPHCYYSSANAEVAKGILIFEDLGHLRIVDIVRGCALEDAQTVVTQLAEHHAKWWQDPRLPMMEAYVKPVNERWGEKPGDQEAHYKSMWSQYEFG